MPINHFQEVLRSLSKFNISIRKSSVPMKGNGFPYFGGNGGEGKRLRSHRLHLRITWQNGSMKLSKELLFSFRMKRVQYFSCMTATWSESGFVSIPA